MINKIRSFYLKNFFIITLGVALGLLLSVWIFGQVSAYQRKVAKRAYMVKELKLEEYGPVQIVTYDGHQFNLQPGGILYHLPSCTCYVPVEQTDPD